MVNISKIQELIVYLGQHPKVRNLGITKLWKMIYFIDSQSLRTLGETVTGSEFIKYEHGPVPSQGEKNLKKLKKIGAVTITQHTAGGCLLNKVVSHRKPNLDIFSEDEISVIEDVCLKFGSKTATELSNISHREPSWIYTEILKPLSVDLMFYGYAEDPVGL